MTLHMTWTIFYLALTWQYISEVQSIILNPFAPGNTPVCGWIFETTDNITIEYRWKISSRFSSNSEADASELLENLEEMFPQYP